MAGTIIRLVPLQAVDWSSLGGSGSLTLIVANYIDLSQWKEGELVARAHGGTTIASGASAVLSFLGFDPAFDDPAANFELATPLTNSNITFNSSTAAPAVSMQYLNANFGLMGRLRLVLNQAGTMLTNTLYLSVDLVLKTDG